MDSITMLATASTLSSVLHALGRIISNTTELRRQWRDADLTIMSLENQLSTLRTALGLIKEWIIQSSSTESGFPELYYQLVMDLDRCIACCRLLISKIDADIAHLQRSTVGDRPSKFTLMRKTRNLKKTQIMVQQQTTALTLLLTVCNSAAISQQKELLEKPQTRRVFKAIEDDTSSLFVHRNADSILTSSSSSSSTVSSTSTFGGASRLLLRFDFDSQLFVSKIYERWIRGPSESAKLNRQLEPRNETNSFEAREKFLAPVQTGDKFLIDGNLLNVVETRDKFSVLPAVITGDKLTPDGIRDTPVETREKFLKDDMIESPISITSDGSTVASSFGSPLTPQQTDSSRIRDKWKPLRLISPTREKSDSQRRSLAIDSALREEHKRKHRHNYTVLLLGSESRLHILIAAKMRNKKREYVSQEREMYRGVIWRTVRECTHALVEEMRRVEINPEARYLWAYVDLIEGYNGDGNDGSRPPELDARFFGALTAVLEDPLIADLVKSSSSGQDGVWPRSARYFFASISRISSLNYVPSERDILYATTFSSTTKSGDKAELNEGDLSLDILDIGGLAGKRGKWIHQFEAARFIIFVVDLDQCDDASKMAETMRLLDAVINSRWFVGASIILVLNISMADHSHRPGSGPGSVRKAAERVLEGFQELKLDRLFIWPCDIAANGSAAIRFILSAVKEAILTKALEEGDILL